MLHAHLAVHRNDVDPTSLKLDFEHIASVVISDRMQFAGDNELSVPSA